MQIFSQSVNSVQKQSQVASAALSKPGNLKNNTEDSKNVSANPVAKVNDVVSISENAKNVFDSKESAPAPEVKNSTSGSFIVNKNRISYSVNENNDLIVKIIDRKSNEVVKQLPPEEMLRVKQALGEILDQNTAITE